MKITLSDDEHDEFSLESNYLLFSTSSDVFVGGKLSINDIYSSLSALILKSYDFIIKIIEKNYKDFNDMNYDFETYISELADSIICNLSNIYNIDKDEMLKQLKDINKEDIITDIINMANKNKDKDKDNNEDDD